MRKPGGVYRKLSVAVLLTAIFSLTLPWRLPFIGNKPHSLEECHLNMLITMQIWEHDGLFTHKAAPVITYPNPGDKFAALFKRLQDSKGNNYYVSYPPLIFMMSFPLYRLTGDGDAKTLMQWINLLLHFVSCILIYLIIRRFSGCEPNRICTGGIAGFVAYAFAPVMLYLHTDIFFPEMLSQVFGLLLIWLWLPMTRPEELPRTSALIWPAVAVFLGVYSGWFALLVCVVMVGWFWFAGFKPFRTKAVLAISLPALLALLLTFVQYSLIAGPRALLVSWFMRYADRSGFFPRGYFNAGDNIMNPETIQSWLGNLVKDAGYFGGLALLMGVVALLLRKAQGGRCNPEPLWIFSLVPALLSVVVFFNATALHYHYASVLCIPAALGCGLQAGRWIAATARPRVVAALLFLLFTFGMGAGLVQYSGYQNTALRSTHPALMQRAAGVVLENAGPDECVFVNYKTENPRPMVLLSLMCRRNILPAADSASAREQMLLLPASKGVYIEYSDKAGRGSVVRFRKKP